MRQTSIIEHCAIRLCGVLLILAAVAGCDPAFNPIDENDRYHFAIDGFLDASADTQWIRVMPVRDSLFFSPAPIDARVTLEHLGSGETVTLNDSLFRYSADRYAWNYWTTQPIEPSAGYRLKAENSEGASSTVRVEIPDDYPTPYVLIADTVFTNDDDKVYIEGIDKLVDARTIYRTRNTQGSGTGYFTIPHIRDSSTTISGTYLVTINPYTEPVEVESRLAGGAELVDRQIYVVAAGPGFNAVPREDDERLLLPGGISNVESGVGYVAGIISKTIPYRECKNEREQTVPCELEKPPW